MHVELLGQHLLGNAVIGKPCVQSRPSAARMFFKELCEYL
jgi:hypothetical protein